MAKKKSIKTALVMAIMSIVACLSMFAGTTFAWFTDSVTSSGNVIKAGRLDVAMYWLDAKEDPNGDEITWNDASKVAIFDYSNWEPGYEDAKHVKIENEGSLAFKYEVKIEANGEISKLAEVIDVYFADPAVQLSGRGELTNKVGTLSDILAGDSIASGSLIENENVIVTIVLKMQESAGDEYQDLSIGTSFDVKVIATQMMYEEDSFGDDYDENATFPEITTDKIGGGECIKAGNVTVELPETAVEAVYTIDVRNKVETVNTAGETTLSLDISLLKDGIKVEETAGVEYTVSIDMGKAVIVNGVTHNGEEVADFSYDPTTYVVTFKTTSFSPFAVSYSDTIYNVSTVEELKTVLENIRTSAKQQIPGTEGNKNYRENAIIVLEDDIVIDSTTEFMYTDSNGAPLHFYGVKGVLDLNGHNITVSEDALIAGKSHANAVLLIQYSNIDIVGEGSIIANNKSIPVYGWANSTVNIYSGTYITNASERNESAVYVNNPTVMINVYGGTYTNSAYAFNAHDNCGNTAVITLHAGITYTTFLKNGTTDVTKNDINNGRIIFADNCELSETENNICTVIKK